MPWVLAPLGMTVWRMRVLLRLAPPLLAPPLLLRLSPVACPTATPTCATYLLPLPPLVALGYHYCPSVGDREL